MRETDGDVAAIAKMKLVLPTYQLATMKPSFFILLAICLSVPLSARAESIEITNPSWQEVPDTLAPDAEEPYNSPAYIDVNSIVTDGAIISYDIVNPNASYGRVETNCHTNQFQAIRKGYFQTTTRVNYISQIDPWSDATEPYHQALLSFVCGP